VSTVAALKPLGIAVVGPIGARAGISAVFWAAALGVLAVTVLTLTVREVRSVRADAPPAG
jgi:hypothetical protein